MNINKFKITNKALLLLATSTVLLNTSCSNSKLVKEEDKTSTVIEGVLDTESFSEIEPVTEQIIESNKEDINMIYIEGEISYDNIRGYAKRETPLKENTFSTSSIENITIYQKVDVLDKTNGFYLVNYNDREGYVKDTDLGLIDGEYIEVDISDQNLVYYDKEGCEVLRSDVVTGLASNPNRVTVQGCYSIYSKEKNRNLKGTNYVSHVDYWMPFYKGYGMHDASWRSTFGGEIYKTKGSHGCVNLPKDVAAKVYEKSSVGTPVLIHE